MPTQRLYYTDSYLLECDAQILELKAATEGYSTRLDRTVFYPTSGGQQFDQGLLGMAEIIDVQDRDGEVWHQTAERPGEAGDSIRCQVDSIRRRRHRQIHTAQHVVSAVLLREYGAETISVHLGADYGAIDIEHGSFSADLISDATEAIQTEIEAAHVTTIHFAEGDEIDRFPLRRPPKKSGRIRIVAIGELDYSACGGTHCRTTAELIAVKINGVERRHGKLSVSFIAGDQYLERFQTLSSVSDMLSRKFNCQPGQIVQRIEAVEQEVRDYRTKLNSAYTLLFGFWADEELKAVEQDKSTKLISSYRPMLTKEQGIAYGNLLLARHSCVVLIGCNDVTLLMSNSTSHSAKKLMAPLLTEFSLRGGGSDQISQTSALPKETFVRCAEHLRGLLGSENA
jgi:alanyl-tRNA synthetase